MENFIFFWENISSGHRLAILIGGMILFWILEGYYTLFPFRTNRYKHAGINLVFLATTVILNLIFGFTTIKVCEWMMKHDLGLLQLVDLPLWLLILLSLFFMDFFGQYMPHYLMHRIKWMWKFHMIHHSDTKVDVTTGTRHHPGEWLFRETGTILGIFILGLPVGLYFLYRSTAAIFSHLNHANIRVPEWLDRPVSWIFVSPNMHKVHHHYVRPYTNSNYSNIFSVWDRLFGTFAYDDPRNLRYGLDVLDDSTDTQLGYQFKIPFDRTIKTDY